MTAKRFNEADIDFDAMDGELAKLVPPKLSLTDVLDRLRKRLVEQQAKGVTVAQMHEVLKSGGIDITERSLRTFLDQGRVAGKEGCRGRQGHGVGRRQRSVLSWNERRIWIREAAIRRSEERRVRRRGFRDANNEVSVGDGRALAWRFSARVRRWREAPSR